MRFLLLFFMFALSINVSVFAYQTTSDNSEDVYEASCISVEEFESLEAVDLSAEDVYFPGFEIRSFRLKHTEATFDLTRNFSGLAQKDTEILIRVFVLESQEEESEEMATLIESDSYQTYVGASGIFSQSVALSLGKNYMIIYVTQGENEIVLKTLIKRKDIEIKQELEQGIIVPGQTLQNRNLIY